MGNDKFNGDGDDNDDDIVDRNRNITNTTIIVEGNGNGDGKNDLPLRGEGEEKGHQRRGNLNFVDGAVDEMVLYPVRITFCTPLFRLKTYVIVVIPAAEKEDEIMVEGEVTIGNINSNNNGALLSPHLNAVERAL